MRKQSIFFSMISIFLISLFVIGVKIASESRIGKSKLETTSIRVEVLNNIVRDFNDRYIERMLYISGKNALKGLSEYYWATSPKKFNFVDRMTGHTYVPATEIPKRHVNEIIGPLIRNGSLNYTKTFRYVGGQYYSDTTQSIDLHPAYLRREYTYKGLSDRLAMEYRAIGLIIDSLEVSEIEVYQEDPWYITMKAHIEYHLRDADSIASWRGEVDKEVKISVYGLRSYDNERWDYELGEFSDQNLVTGTITSNWKADRMYGANPALINNTLPGGAEPDNPSYCKEAHKTTLGSYYDHGCWSEFSVIDKLSGYGPDEWEDVARGVWKIGAPSTMHTIGLCQSDYCESDIGKNYDDLIVCSSPNDENRRIYFRMRTTGCP